MKKKTNVLIAGPLPPPAGGISVHIWRLKHLLEDEFQLDFIDEASTRKHGYFSVKSFNPIGYLKRIIHADVLFIHSGSRILKKLHILTGKLMGKKLIVTLHGYGARRPFPFRQMDAFFFGLADKIILVNDGIMDKVHLPAHKVIVKHAFLPPVMSEEPMLPASIASHVQKARQKNKVLLCANASRLDLHNNQDLYGLDMSIEVTRRLLGKGLPVSFVYTVSALDRGLERFNKGQQMIGEYRINEDFLLVNEKLSFARLIEQSDIVLRPTNTDGDALTIREAIYLDKKVLASDVVQRPDGTNLFKTRDINDLEQRLEKMVRDIPAGTSVHKGINKTNEEEYQHFYINLIRELVPGNDTRLANA